MGKALAAIVIVIAIVGGIIWVISNDVFGDPATTAARTQEQLTELGEDFRDTGHLPWNRDAEITSIRFDPMRLTLTVKAIAPSEDIVQSTVCNYRRMRQLIEKGVKFVILWKPEGHGPSMAVSEIKECMPVR